MSESTIAAYDALAVPLTITDDTVARGLLNMADTFCMHQETRAYIERRWDFDRRWSKENEVRFRRDRLGEYNELKVRMDVLRSALRTMIGPMMNADVPVLKGSYLLDAAVNNVIAAAGQERQRARDTSEPQWYRSA